LSDWHAIITFRKPKPPEKYCVFFTALSLRFVPQGEAKSPLDSLFHPAKIHSLSPTQTNILIKFPPEGIQGMKRRSKLFLSFDHVNVGRFEQSDDFFSLFQFQITASSCAWGCSVLFASPASLRALSGRFKERKIIKWAPMKLLCEGDRRTRDELLWNRGPMGFGKLVGARGFIIKLQINFNRGVRRFS